MSAVPPEGDPAYDAIFCDAVRHLLEHVDFGSLDISERNALIKDLARQATNRTDLKSAHTAIFRLVLLASEPRSGPQSFSFEQFNGAFNLTSNYQSGNVGSAVGQGASVTAQTIVGYSNDVQTSAGLDEGLKTALIEARQAIDQLKESQQVRDTLAVQLQQLTEALKSQQKDKSLIKVLWSGITSIAGAVPAIAKLGKLVAPFIGLPA